MTLLFPARHYVWPDVRTEGLLAYTRVGGIADGIFCRSGLRDWPPLDLYWKRGPLTPVFVHLEQPSH